MGTIPKEGSEGRDVFWIWHRRIASDQGAVVVVGGRELCLAMSIRLFRDSINTNRPISQRLGAC